MFALDSDKTPCYLELKNASTGLRMNCFEIAGTLHIHSSRWAKLPRFSGESWTVTVQREPNVRVEIDGAIYRLRASAITNEEQRQQILYNRGYWHPWDAIMVFQFYPLSDA